MYLRRNNAKCTVPIASLYVRNRRTAIKAQQITATVHQAMTVNFHRTGIAADDVSARSLRAGGAMALLCHKVDMNLIQMLGLWHSDAMIRYFHMQAQPIVQHFAAKKYNNRNYSFLPDETVPLLHEDAEL
jgi:site-specific recombinase XerD